MIEIIPTILTNNPSEVEEKINKLEGLVKRAQLDILDGVFADNRTTGLEALASIETGILLDVHLMTKEPVDWVEKSVRAMADRIIGHIELMSNQEGYVRKVIEIGAQVGLGVDLDTPLGELDEAVLGEVDLILLMSVKAGWGGQEFQSKALDKIKELAEARSREGLNFKICVDGGINEGNIKRVVEAGADEVAVGTAIYQGGNIEANLERLLNAGSS